MDITNENLEYDKHYDVYVYAIYDYYDNYAVNPSSKGTVKLLLNRNKKDVELAKLPEPRFNVTRYASYENNDYAINFTVGIDDAFESLTNGKYYVELRKENDVVGNLKMKENGSYIPVNCNEIGYENCSLDAAVNNREYKITGLESDTKYTLKVYGTAYLNNYDEDKTTVQERTVLVESTYTIYSTNSNGVAFGKEVTFSATEHSLVLTFNGGSSFDNVESYMYTIGLWSNYQDDNFIDINQTVSSDDYIELANSTNKFQFVNDQYQFVISPPGMVFNKNSTYMAVVLFKVKVSDNDYSTVRFAKDVAYSDENN